MEGFDVWDGVLLAIGVYVAVMTLVHLMSDKRQQLTDRLREEIREEQQRMQVQEKRRKKLAERATKRGRRAA